MNIIVYEKGSREFKETIKQIENQGDTLCQNMNGNSEIAMSYIKYATTNNIKYVMIAVPSVRQTRSTGRKINGFVLIKENKDSLYIDVICAKGAGFKLLESVEKMGKALGKMYISLSALPSAINVYRKFGFVHTEKSCMENPVIAKLGEALKYERFSSSSRAVEDKRFSKLLSELVKMKLVSDKKCRTVHQCSVDGYSMTKCII